VFHISILGIEAFSGGAKWWQNWISGPVWQRAPPIGGYGVRLIRLCSPRSLHRDHSIIACSRHIYMVLFFAHIPFLVNCAFNATPTERLQQYDDQCIVHSLVYA